MFHGQFLKEFTSDTLCCEELKSRITGDGLIFLDHTFNDEDCRVNIGEHLTIKDGQVLITDFKINMDNGKISSVEIPLYIIDNKNTNISIAYDSENNLTVLKINRDFSPEDHYALRMAFFMTPPKKDKFFKLRPSCRTWIHLLTLWGIREADSIMGKYLQSKNNIVPIKLNRLFVSEDIQTRPTCQFFLYTEKPWKIQSSPPLDEPYDYWEYPYSDERLETPIRGYRWELSESPYYKDKELISTTKEVPPINLEFEKYDYNLIITLLFVFFSSASFLKAVIGISIFWSLLLGVTLTLIIYGIYAARPEI